jgi:general secretion pathway protein J
MTMRARGFTLVEVLVALLILSVLSVMAWRGIDGMARARDGSQAQMEGTLRLNTVIAQWEQDLASIHDTDAVPALSFDGATVRLARTVPGGVQLVAWSLRGSQWLRWAGPVVQRSAALQESWLSSQQLLGNETGQLRLVDGVSEVQIYFYRGNGWSNAQSTGDMAPASAAPGAQQRQVLPAGVRLVLTQHGRQLTRDVLLGPQVS